MFWPFYHRSEYETIRCKQVNNYVEVKIKTFLCVFWLFNSKLLFKSLTIGSHLMFCNGLKRVHLKTGDFCKLYCFLLRTCSIPTSFALKLPDFTWFWCAINPSWSCKVIMFTLGESSQCLLVLMVECCNGPPPVREEKKCNYCVFWFHLTAALAAVRYCMICSAGSGVSWFDVPFC